MLTSFRLTLTFACRFWTFALRLPALLTLRLPELTLPVRPCVAGLAAAPPDGAFGRAAAPPDGALGLLAAGAAGRAAAPPLGRAAAPPPERAAPPPPPRIAPPPPRPPPRASAGTAVPATSDALSASMDVKRRANRHGRIFPSRSIEDMAHLRASGTPLRSSGRNDDARVHHRATARARHVRIHLGGHQDLEVLERRLGLERALEVLVDGQDADVLRRAGFRLQPDDVRRGLIEDGRGRSQVRHLDLHPGVAVLLAFHLHLADRRRDHLRRVHRPGLLVAHGPAATQREHAHERSRDTPTPQTLKFHGHTPHAYRLASRPDSTSASGGLAAGKSAVFFAAGPSKS